MERTTKKRNLRNKVDGRNAQNKSKIAKTNSRNNATTSDAVKMEPTNTDTVQLLNEVWPDDKSLIIKLEYSPDSPVTSDCLSLAQIQQTVGDSQLKPEQDLPECSDGDTTSDGEDERDLIKKRYITRSDMVVNMDRLSKAEREACIRLEPEFVEKAENYELKDIHEDPECLFEFFFFPLPTPPIPPELKIRKFSEASGPIKKITLYEAFTAIWNTTVMEHIVHETNKNADKFSKSEWTATSVDELYVFFAVTLATSEIENWKKFWNFPTDISQAMTLNRFMKLQNFLSFSECDLSVYKQLQTKLRKVKPLVDHLNKSFSSLYKIGQDIVLDEPITLCKNGDGKYEKLVNMCGVQEVNVCDAKTGYVWKLDVIAQDAKITRGIPPCLILDFLNELVNKGHTVWSNNAFHSLLLARVLKELGFNTVGTILMTDIIPQEYLQPKKDDVSGCTSGDLDVIAWGHKNLVSFVSNYHGKTTIEENGKLIPAAVVDYKNNVASLDKRDQMLAVYSKGGKCKSWFHVIFQRLLNISVFNSSILHKCTEQSVESQKESRCELIHELISRHREKENGFEIKKENPSKRVVLPESYLDHFPEELGKKQKIKNSCVLCRSLTVTYCPACNVPLCLSSCHKLYHSVSIDTPE